MCRDFSLSTCFADTGDASCDVDSSETNSLKEKFLNGHTTSDNPTHYVLLGGMGAGKSYAARTLNEKGYVDHVIGKAEVNLVFDDMLMSTNIFNASTMLDPVPTKLYDNCWPWVEQFYNDVRAVARTNKYSTFTEMSTLEKATRCTDLQDTLDMGYDIFVVFVHSDAERGLCNVLAREDREKRYASIDDVEEAYSRAADGETSKDCLRKLKPAAGKTVKWAYCENDNLQMDCMEPEVMAAGVV